MLHSYRAANQERTTYSDAEYVMFADTMSLHMIPDDAEHYFAVQVASTKSCDYDRTFGVEVIDKDSKAIEGLHYRLKSNTITIPAGKLATEILVHGNYAALEIADTVNFNLRLVMPEQLEWEFYGNGTNVKMVKSCPFALENYTGWCVVTSTFLQDYPGVDNKSIQRLIRTEKHPTEENLVILHDWLFNGYDVTLRFDPTDPAEPKVSMDSDQVISDEASVFRNHPRRQQNPDGKRPELCIVLQRVRKLRNALVHMYVENLGTPVGSVGNFYTILEWVSDEEADRLQREEGM